MACDQKDDNDHFLSNSESIPREERFVNAVEAAAIKAMVDVMQKYFRDYENKPCETFFPKTIVASRYDILKLHDQYFAIHDQFIHAKYLSKAKYQQDASHFEIHLGQELDTNQLCLVKSYAIKNNMILLEKLEKEVYLLHKVNRLLGTNLHHPFKKNIYIVQEYAPGIDLHQALFQKKLPLSLEEKIMIASNLTNELLNLHERYNMTHGDIKLENTIWDPQTNKVTLVDFEAAQEMNVYKKSIVSDTTIKPKFVAPEIFRNNQYIFDEKSEVYALGKTLLELFESGLNEVHGTAEKNIMSMFTAMIHEDPTKRPTLKKVSEYLNQLKTHDIASGNFIQLDV